MKSAQAAGRAFSANFGKEFVNLPADNFQTRQSHDRGRSVVHIEVPAIVVGHEDHIQGRHRQNMTGAALPMRMGADRLQVAALMFFDMLLQRFLNVLR